MKGYRGLVLILAGALFYATVSFVFFFFYIVSKSTLWYGASLGGALCYINNPTLRIFSHTCLHISRTHLHTTSDDDQTRRHICTNNRQTPSPWWWSRSPLQRRGFDESMPPEGWAALCMLDPMPPSKRFNIFIKLK
jgi:hypothetical protein